MSNASSSEDEPEASTSSSSCSGSSTSGGGGAASLLPPSLFFTLSKKPMDPLLGVDSIHRFSGRLSTRTGFAAPDYNAAVRSLIAVAAIAGCTADDTDAISSVRVGRVMVATTLDLANPMPQS